MKFIRLIKSNQDLKLVVMHYKDFDKNEDKDNACFLLVKNDVTLKNSEVETRISGNESDSELIEKASKYLGNLPKDIEVKKFEISFDIKRGL